MWLIRVITAHCCTPVSYLVNGQYLTAAASRLPIPPSFSTGQHTVQGRLWVPAHRMLPTRFFLIVKRGAKIQLTIARNRIATASPSVISLLNLQWDTLPPATPVLAPRDWHWLERSSNLRGALKLWDCSIPGRATRNRHLANAHSLKFFNQWCQMSSGYPLSNFSRYASGIDTESGKILGRVIILKRSICRLQSDKGEIW